MGYVRKAPIVNLVFDDEEYEGLEIRMKSMPLGEFIEMDQKLQDADDDRDGKTQNANGHRDEAFSTTMKKLSDKLVSWNLEREDRTPVPATYDGLLEQDLVFVRDILHAYKVSLFGVDNPLPEGSSDGETFPEASIPMETLSPSQAS